MLLYRFPMNIDVRYIGKNEVNYIKNSKVCLAFYKTVSCFH